MNRKLATAVNAVLAVAMIFIAIPPIMPSSEVETLKNEVSLQMRDPSSVIFYGVHIVHKEAEHRLVLCGFYNAKNAYGGYIGITPFAYFYHEPAKLVMTEPVVTRWNCGVP
jgi:hypothetical protein